MTKKKIGLLGVLGLTLSLSFNPSSSLAAIPIEASAIPAKSITNSDVQPYASKYIENYMVQYNDVIVPPSTYYYNKAGWTGTLRLRSYQQYPTTGITQAYYYGYVSCTGECG